MNDRFKILIENEQDIIKDIEETENLVREVVFKSLENFLPKQNIEIFILLTNNAQIKEINNEQRDKAEATDVLSFPMLEGYNGIVEYSENDINPEDDFLILGDIILSVERAVEQAEEYGHSINREIGFLICHGIHHLIGYDHDTKERETEMMDKQENILNSIGLER